MSFGSMSFAQPFQNQFATIQKHDVFKIKQKLSGSKNSDYCDRCLISYSLAQIAVEWFILLDQTKPSQNPDFIFSGTPDFHPKRILPWEIRDDDSLNSILVDLRNQFIAYQKDLIKKMDNPTLTFEVETIETIGGSEFFCLPDQRIANISLPLTMLTSMTSLIAPSLKDLPILTIIFNLNGTGNRQHSIDFPPNWPLNYPSKTSDYPNFEVDLTIDYLTILSTFWEARLKVVQQNQQYLEIFRNAYQEMDSSPLHFQFLFKHGDLQAIIKLELHNEFPASPPILIIVPLAKDGTERPKDFKRIDDMPWSPRWKPEEVLSKVKAFIQKQLESIKEVTLKNVISNLSNNFNW
jgi:hypothetical protein